MTKKKTEILPEKVPAEIMRSETQVPALLGSVNIESLITKALEKESPLEVLEKLMTMRREMQADAARIAYYDALSRFQADCPPIVKSKTAGGGSFSYSYAPLDVIVSAVQFMLKNCGLSYTIEARQDEKSVTAVCISHHRDGHSEKTEFTIPIDAKARMNDAQKTASALTYAKRYAFCNAFGVLTCDEDDEARRSDSKNAAGNREPVNMPKEKKPEDKTGIVEGAIEDVAVKTGKKDNGQEWTRWGVKVAGNYYGTFSRTLGAQAQELDENRIPIKITYKADGKHKTITAIDPIGVDVCHVCGKNPGETYIVDGEERFVCLDCLPQERRDEMADTQAPSEAVEAPPAFATETPATLSPEYACGVCGEEVTPETGYVRSGDGVAFHDACRKSIPEQSEPAKPTVKEIRKQLHGQVKLGTELLPEDTTEILANQDEVRNEREIPYRGITKGDLLKRILKHGAVIGTDEWGIEVEAYRVEHKIVSKDRQRWNREHLIALLTMLDNYGQAPDGQPEEDFKEF